MVTSDAPAAMLPRFVNPVVAGVLFSRALVNCTFDAAAPPVLVKRRDATTSFVVPLRDSDGCTIMVAGSGATETTLRTTTLSTDTPQACPGRTSEQMPN